MTSPAEPPIPKRYPPYLTAGTTLKVDRIFEPYSNVDFTYKLYLAGATLANKAATADPDGVTFHLVLMPSDTSPLFPSGTGSAEPIPYRYVERLTDSVTSEVYDVGSGRIMVNPDLSAVLAGDAISFEEKTLAMIEAVLQNRVTADVEQYSIAGRSITKIAIPELIKLRGTYRALVWKQRNPGKLTVPVEVTFPTIDLGPLPPWWTNAPPN